MAQFKGLSWGGRKCYSLSMRSGLWLTFFLLASVPQLAQQPKSEDPTCVAGTKGVKPPQALFTPAPDVYLDSRKVKSNGIVVLTGYVGTDGKFHDAKVLRSIGDAKLDSKALDTASTWKFRPASKDGKACNCRMNLEIAFNIR